MAAAAETARRAALARQRLAERRPGSGKPEADDGAARAEREREQPCHRKRARHRKLRHESREDYERDRVQECQQERRQEEPRSGLRRLGRPPRPQLRKQHPPAEPDQEQRAADVDDRTMSRDERQDERAEQEGAECVQEVRERGAERGYAPAAKPWRAPVPKISSAIGPTVPDTMTPKTNAFHIAAVLAQVEARLSRSARARPAPSTTQ